ncbi:hypothetical protein KF7HA_00085 [Lactococcus lactis]|nr:hypothetical protein [Lactococcus lactis]
MAHSTGNSRRLKDTFEKEKKEDKIIQALPHHVKNIIKCFNLLNSVFINQLQIKVKYQSKNKLNEVYVLYSDLSINQR